MDATSFQENKENDKKKGRIISAIVHGLVLLLAFLPIITYQDPPPGQAGVMISFGDESLGFNDDSNPQGETMEQPASSENDEVDQPEEPKPAKSKPKPKSKDTPVKLVSDHSDNKSVKKPKDAKKDTKSDSKKDTKTDSKSDTKSTSETNTKATTPKSTEPSDQDKLDDAKSKFGNPFTNDGEGAGNTKPGPTGTDAGNPDETVLGTVPGELGGDLSGRGVVSRPTITANTQKKGDVVVRVCIGANGKVSKSEFRQLGSTTNDINLIEIAVKQAKNYRFTSKDSDKEDCGTITIKFKVQ